MKKLLISLANLLIFAMVFAQSPDKISYQAVIRDANGNILKNHTIGIKISILKNNIVGSSVFVERHFHTTNTNGLVNIQIGSGELVSGDISKIDWSSDLYFIKTETAINGDANYSITSTSQLLSVPYALHSTTATGLKGTISESQIHDLKIYLDANSFDLNNPDMGDIIQFNGEKWIRTSPDYASVIHNHTVATNNVDGFMSKEDKLKMESIDAGANKNVQADWNQISNKTDNYIRNKPDLSVYTTFTDLDGKVDKETGKSLQAMGTQIGQMQYWNGSEWLPVKPGKTGQVLTFIGGTPTWGPQLGMNDVLNPVTGKIWMDRNLGATQVASSRTNASSYGDLYQWGRGADGHQIRNSDTTTTLSISDIPGHARFILSGEPHDWRSSRNDSLWQGVNGINNPCPCGYRLPTEAEWTEERDSWVSKNSAGAFASPLKLTSAGYRKGSDGTLTNIGNAGYYWSSTTRTNNYIARMYIGNTSAGVGYFFKTDGYSVRCIKDY